MKILRNPWVVSVLALVALIVVGYQVILPLKRQTTVTTSPLPPAVATATSSVAELPSAPKSPSVPEAMMDRDYIETNFAEWMKAPPRDPFQFIKTKPEANELPLGQLKLKAVWRQTAGSMAAINKGIYQEGDTVEGYTIKTINDDEVWLQGSAGKVRLGFSGDESTPAAPDDSHADVPSVTAQHP